MPPDHGTGRGANLRAVLYFLASTPFLVILVLGLHFCGIITLDRITALLHGGHTPGTRVVLPPTTPTSDPAVPTPPTTEPTSPANQPPKLSAPAVVEFDKGDATKVVELRLTDENTSGLKVAVTSQNESILPASGLKLTNMGRTSHLEVTPKPGTWGNVVLRVTATDTAGLSGVAVITVTVPEPAFALAAIAPVTVNRGDPISPIRLKVTDESSVPGKVRFTALADGSVLKSDGISIVNDRLELKPVPDAIGSATVTVLASADDGREDRKTFILTVTKESDGPLVVGGKAQLTPSVDLISSEAEAVGGRNLGVPDLERGMEVRVAEIRGKRVRISWQVGKLSYLGWVDAAILTPIK